MPQELTYEAAFPGRFLKAALLNERNVTVEIERIYMEVLEGEKGEANKLIAKFSGKTMELVLCKTNALCVKEMFGSKVAGWLGKRITLTPTKVNFGPKKVDAIRIFGSPDIASPVEVAARIGRKQFKATMQRVLPGQHGFKGGEPRMPVVLEQTPADATDSDFSFTYNPDSEPSE